MKTPENLVNRIDNKVKKYLDKRMIERNVMRKQPRATLRVRETKQEPYRSIYFKQEFEKEKRDLFWK